jgi:transketolase
MTTLFQIVEDDPDVLLLTGDLGYGLFEAFEEKYPKQYLNVGVAEQNMIGCASGLALEGKKIFVYSIGNFATLRCLEQIRNDACYHGLNINIVANGGGFSYGGLGMSHHATEDISIMRALPGVTVVVPSSAFEAGHATRALYQQKGVGYLRLDKSKTKELGEIQENFQLGVSFKLREGKDITLITCGGITEEVLASAEELSKIGIECRVISMCTIKPIDVNSIKEACKETLGIVTIEENNLIGGLGSAVSEVCMDNNYRPKFFDRVALNDQYSTVVGSQKFLRKKYRMDSGHISKIVKGLLIS